METSRQQARRGQALIIFGVMSLVIAGFVALVTDGGLTYVERRKAQTAADLIARAGANAKGTGGSDYDATVLKAMSAAAVANGYLPQEVIMRYINSSGANVASVGAGTPSSSTGAVGVRAVVNHKFNTFFASLLNQAQSEVTATAALSLGGAVGFNGMAPFITCGATSGMRNINTGAYETIMNSDGSVNSSMIGHEYTLWGNNANQVCLNKNGSYKGNADTGDDATSDGATCNALPCAYQTSNGTTTGPTNVLLGQAIDGVSGCANYSWNNGGGSGCILILPMADMTSPCDGQSINYNQSNNNWICVKGWAFWELTDNCSAPYAGSNCKQTAKLKGNGIIVNGVPGPCNLSSCPGADATGPKVISAIE